MATGEVEENSPTVVTDSPLVFGLMWIGFPVLGAGVLLALSLLSTWVVSLAWAPLQGLFELVTSIPDPQRTVGALVVGALIGLGVATIGQMESLKVSITPQRIVATRIGKSKEVDAAAVAVAFKDGKQLVLQDQLGQEPLRETCDLSEKKLRAGFVANGFRWSDEGDPHKGDFRRWVDGTPDLTGNANTLLRSRKKALDNWTNDESEAIRDELARMGIVVRQEKKVQFWRKVSD